MMQDKLQSFLNSISFNKYDEVSSLKIDKVILKKATETFEVYLTSPMALRPELIDELITCAKKGINGEQACLINFHYAQITNEDIINTFKYILNKLVTKKPALSNILEANIELDEQVLIISVGTKIEEELLMEYAKKIIKTMASYGFADLDITTKIDEETAKQIKEEINKVHETGKLDTPKEVKTILIGKHIDGELTKISDLLGEQTNVIVEAYVFGKETKNTEKTNIMTLKISDKTNSILAKFFVRELDEFNEIDSLIKEDKWYRLHGNVKYDDFAKDFVFMVRNMEAISSKTTTIKDEEPIKRVELHAHTMMSMMDSVVGLDLTKHTCDLTDFAMKLGMRGVAITDHNGCQAFPIAFENIKKFNKDKEDKDKFKGLYGAEINVVDDDVDVVFNQGEVKYDILEEEYVVFDTETTGLYAGYDQMIEIGAVKIKKGEIIDRFDELINPGRKLPTKITELTNITDEMLQDKDTEENVTKRFLEWAGKDPMVAHNAKFDIGFINAACKKYNLGEFKATVVDTMGIARMLYADWSNHKLSTLVKKLNVEWNEDEHHRADYDAAGTAKCFYKMCKTLYDRNIEDTTSINEQVDKNSIIKFARPFHMNIIAKNKVGLKNLFKIISLANTTYLFKNAQPKIPRKELLKYHEGILFGSGCINNEIFINAQNKDDEELVNMMQFYDYIEVQPISSMTQLLQLEESGFNSEIALQNHLKKIIRVAKEAGKLVEATGDVHNLTTEDLISRKIIVRQKNNGHFHPLYHKGVDVPDMRFLTTKEMLDAFSFLDHDLAYEIVVTNTNKICDMVDDIEDIAKIIDEMVRNKAQELYGNPLPDLIKERVDHELHIIIDDHYDVEYLIAQKLVQKSNEDGFLVGSRGSVGSSFVATMMGITEVNPLPAHYRCPKCKLSIFKSDEGVDLGSLYSSGFDLPDKDCPKCGTKMVKDGNDMPFATFLGFNGDKVPDIDLNFSDLNQADIHDYCKVLFGNDNAYRAGTISTVAEKTAFGYVKGYCEDNGIVMRSIETERLAKGCTGVKKTTGQHPGGIVVIPEYMDVFDFTPFQFPAEDPSAKWRTTHFDYHSIQDDVLKLDILGHTDPTQLRMIKDLTGMDPQEVPLDDKDTMGIFLSRKPLGVTSDQINFPRGTLGVPEFGTPFTIQLVQDTKPKTFAELIKISGLSHGTDVWLGNAQELIKSNIVPFKEVIGCRDDIMVYLMYHNVEPIKAFKIMEFVRKGKASKDPETWKGFAETMKQAGIEEWFIDSCQKIKYMFPKAHAAAYVISAFRIAWYKVHMPVYFYSSWFTTKATDFDIDVMIKGYDAIKEKIIEIKNKGFDATNKESGILEWLKVCLEATARGINFA